MILVPSLVNCNNNYFFSHIIVLSSKLTGSVPDCKKYLVLNHIDCNKTTIMYKEKCFDIDKENILGFDELLTQLHFI